MKQEEWRVIPDFPETRPAATGKSVTTGRLAVLPGS